MQAIQMRGQPAPIYAGGTWSTRVLTDAKENDTMEALREIASSVRSIVEDVSVDIRKSFYANPFPAEWCQDTLRCLEADQEAL